MTTLDQVRQFIERHISLDEFGAFSNEDNIFKLGFVSSLFAMQIVAFVETTFNVAVANDDLNLENFCSVTNIVRFVDTKQGAQ